MNTTNTPHPLFVDAAKPRKSMIHVPELPGKLDSEEVSQIGQRVPLFTMFGMILFIVMLIGQAAM